MRVAGAAAAKARLTSMVAVPPEIEMLRRRLQDGTAVVTPAARSAAFGPAKSSRTAAVATPGTRGTVRFVSHSLPVPRSSQTSSVIREPRWDVAFAVPAASETARRATRGTIRRFRMVRSFPVGRARLPRPPRHRPIPARQVPLAPHAGRSPERRQPEHARAARSGDVRHGDAGPARDDDLRVGEGPARHRALLADEQRGGVRHDDPRGGDGHRRPDREPGRLDALQLRDPRRARDLPPAGGRGAPLRRRVARGVAPEVRHRRRRLAPDPRGGPGRVPHGARAPGGGDPMSYDHRLAAARAAMDEAGVGAMVVSGLVNIRYLTGFTGSNALVVIGPESATLLTDFRYQTASEPLRAWVDVELAERDVIHTAAGRLGDLAGGAERIGFEPALLTVERH